MMGAPEATTGAALRPVVAVVAVSVVAYVVLRLSARRARRATGPGTALRRLLLVGLPAVAVVALLALVLADLPALLGRAMATAAPALDDTPVQAAVVQFGTGLGVVVAVLAGYLGTVPAIREVRGIEIGARRASRRLARYLLVLLAGMVVVLQAAVAMLAVASPAATVALFVPVMVAVALAGAPAFVGLTRSTREPTAAERERLADLLATADLPVRGVRVLDADEEEVGQAFVRGLPGRRYLFVTDYLLADVPGERAATVVAVAAGQARYGYVAYRTGVLALGLTALLGELLFGAVGDLTGAAGLPGVLGPVVVLLAVVGLLYGGQRLVYRVDDYAADRVGAETVARSLEAAAEKYGLRYDAGRVVSLLAMRPPIGRRIGRLYAGSEGDRDPD